LLDGGIVTKRPGERRIKRQFGEEREEKKRLEEKIKMMNS